MADFLLIRPDDLLVLGVRWSGFTVSGDGSTTRLVAGAQAHLVLLLPPQHVGEESSPPGSAAPPPALPTGSGGTAVPAWRGVVSGPSRLAFDIAPGTQIPLSAEGLLAAVRNSSLQVPAGVPGPFETAIELPWRLVIAPRGRSAGVAVICEHLSKPLSANSSGLWRTRLRDSTSAADPTLAADLTLRVTNRETAEMEDPSFGANNAISLRKNDRRQLFIETNNPTNPLARVSRLELTALGGTLDVVAKFPNFEWEHSAVLGRDMHVRTLAKGAMYPLGHRAELLTVTQRSFDKDAGNAAVLRTVRVLTIVEPVRHAPGDGRVRRAFPFGDVECTRTVFTDIAPEQWFETTLPQVGLVDTHFWPTTLAGVKVQFPIACTTSSGAINIELPLLFVKDWRPNTDSLTNPGLAQQLFDRYGEAEVSIAPTNIDLVGTNTALNVASMTGDVHEVRALKFAGAQVVEDGHNLADGYRSKLTELEVGLPALRGLLGNDPRTKVAFGQKYLQNGADDMLLQMKNDVPITFTNAADRSGGILAPAFKTNAISRKWGPVNGSALPNPVTGIIDPRQLFPTDDATLLGFPLNKLLKDLKEPPQIKHIPIPGSAPKIEMKWTDVKLTDVGPFKTKTTSKLDLTVTITPTPEPSKVETTCTVTDFTLELPPGPEKSLILVFRSMKYEQLDGKSPGLDVKLADTQFVGDLKLLQDLKNAVDLGAAGKLIDVKPSGLTVRYSLPIPSISAGAFTMRNMVFTAAIEVPFAPVITGQPLSVVVRLGFASRANPFQLAVTMFGGGGYIELELNRDGLKRLEAAMEFGAFVAVDFVIARGEVHALGGVRFVLESDGSVTVTGYLRIGGCVEILGLISVSIELCLSLTYRSSDNALIGRATLVIEIDLTLWSERVEIDSGEWQLPGSGSSRDSFALTAARFDAFEAWKSYRAAFAADDIRIGADRSAQGN